MKIASSIFIRKALHPRLETIFLPVKRKRRPCRTRKRTIGRRGGKAKGAEGGKKEEKNMNVGGLGRETADFQTKP